MSPVVILTLYLAPHLSANPPASFITLAARFTPSITLLPYAADCPVCPLMLEKCTTFSCANAVTTPDASIAASTRGMSRVMARSFSCGGVERPRQRDAAPAAQGCQ